MLGTAKATGLVFGEKPSIDIEPTNLPDRSRFGNHGTYTNITDVRLPSGLWVRSFNGSTSYLSIAHDPSITFTNQNFSIQAWIYSLQLVHGIIAEKGFPNARGWDFRLPTNKTLYFRVYQVDASQVSISNAVIEVQTWYHIVAVRRATTIYLYVNSVDESSSQPAITDPLTSTDALEIGRGSYENYGGYIALPGIYNYALSAGKIKQIFESERWMFGV